MVYGKPGMNIPHLVSDETGRMNLNCFSIWRKSTRRFESYHKDNEELWERSLESIAGMMRASQGLF